MYKFQTSEEWAAVFYISGTLYLIGAVFYAIFASAERQPWAMDNKEIDKKKETNGYTNPALNMDETSAQQPV